MARIYGLNGIIRGRQGNNVFSVQNGTQVLKEYQPVVSNPRTSGQQEQRAKFALAGKMSGATPSLALSGMLGGSPRDKRARFVQLVSRGASTTTSSGVITAAIPFNDVVYSEGSMSLYSSMPSFTARYGTGVIGSNSVTVTITPGNPASYAPEGYSELFVIALYDAADSSLEEVQVRERTVGGITMNFRIGTPREVTCVGYVIPFVRTSRNAAQIIGNVAGTETAATLASSQNRVISGAEWGRSLMFSVVPVPMPSRDSDDVDVEEDKKKVVSRRISN